MHIDNNTTSIFYSFPLILNSSIYFNQFMENIRDLLVCVVSKVCKQHCFEEYLELTRIWEEALMNNLLTNLRTKPYMPFYLVNKHNWQLCRFLYSLKIFFSPTNHIGKFNLFSAPRRNSFINSIKCIFQHFLYIFCLG